MQSKESESKATGEPKQPEVRTPEAHPKESSASPAPSYVERSKHQDDGVDRGASGHVRSASGRTQKDSSIGARTSCREAGASERACSVTRDAESDAARDQNETAQRQIDRGGIICVVEAVSAGGIVGIFFPKTGAAVATALSAACRNHTSEQTHNNAETKNQNETSIRNEYRNCVERSTRIDSLGQTRITHP
jgi:hypothetical protein